MSRILKAARTVIHIDVDPSSISKRVKAQIPIVGDVKSVLADMVSLLEERGLSAEHRAAHALVESD